MMWDCKNLPEMLTWPKAPEYVMEAFQKSETKGRVLHVEDEKDLDVLEQMYLSIKARRGASSVAAYKDEKYADALGNERLSHEQYIRCVQQMNSAYAIVRDMARERGKWAKWILNPEAVEYHGNWLTWPDLGFYPMGRACPWDVSTDLKPTLAATYDFPSAEEKKGVGQLLREMHSLMEQVVLQKSDRADAIRRKFGAFEMEALK